MELRLQIDFLEFVRSLNDAGVKYLIIGAHAVGFHSNPRTTEDLDVWVEKSPLNAKKLLQAIKNFGLEGLGLKPEDFLEGESVIQLGVAPVMIHIMTEASGVEFDECYLNSIVAPVEGIQARWISRSDLLKNKRATGRKKDRQDIRALSKKK